MHQVSMSVKFSSFMIGWVFDSPCRKTFEPVFAE